MQVVKAVFIFSMLEQTNVTTQATRKGPGPGS